MKTVTVYLDLDCRRGEERKVGLMKFVWILKKMEGELWVGMVGNRSFLISLNRWNAEREKRFKLSIMSLWFQFIPISKKKKKTKQKKTNKQTK